MSCNVAVSVARKYRPACKFRDAGQGFLVEVGGRIDAPAPTDDRRNLELLCADADRVYPEPDLSGEFGCLERIDLARGIRTVRK